MANTANGRLSKGEAAAETEKMTKPRRQPRTVAEQMAELKAKGRKDLEKLNDRLGVQLVTLASTVRRIEAQRAALDMEPWAPVPGRYILEVTESGQYLHPERDEPGSAVTSTDTPAQTDEPTGEPVSEGGDTDGGDTDGGDTDGGDN